MSRPRSFSTGLRVAFCAGCFLALPACAQTPRAAEPTSPRPQALQPSAPGQPSRVLSAEELVAAVHPEHTPADTRFMQGMLAHHAQAIVMTGLVAERTQNRDIRLLARRIELSQDDEIAIMRRWLVDRQESVPELQLRYAAAEVSGAHDHGHHAHGHAQPASPAPHGHGDDSLHGMLSQEELDTLASASGAAFDRLFLAFMIRHHQGAIQMVETLFSSGSGQETEIFQFASHVEGDQHIEIRRMQGMLQALESSRSPSPAPGVLE
jgi:uncharacterized protein (DUF305 family)